MTTDTRTPHPHPVPAGEVEMTEALDKAIRMYHPQLIGKRVYAGEIYNEVKAALRQGAPSDESVLNQQAVAKRLRKELLADGYDVSDECLQQILRKLAPYLRSQGAPEQPPVRVVAATCICGRQMEVTGNVVNEQPDQAPLCPYCRRQASGKGHSYIGGYFWHCLCGNKWDAPAPPIKGLGVKQPDGLSEARRIWENGCNSIHDNEAWENFRGGWECCEHYMGERNGDSAAAVVDQLGRSQGSALIKPVPEAAGSIPADLAPIKSQPDVDALLQDVTALRIHGSKLVASLEELSQDNMITHARHLMGLQWWSFAEKRIEDWKRYLRALDRDGISAPVRESGAVDALRRINKMLSDAVGAGKLKQPIMSESDSRFLWIFDVTKEALADVEGDE